MTYHILNYLLKTIAIKAIVEILIECFLGAGVDLILQTSYLEIALFSQKPFPSWVLGSWMFANTITTPANRFQLLSLPRGRSTLILVPFFLF